MVHVDDDDDDDEYLLLYSSEDFHLWENKDILVNLHLLPFFIE